MNTQEELLEQAIRIARGRSGVEPSVHHLIVLDLELTQLREANALLRRTVEMLDKLNQESLEAFKTLPVRGSV